MVDFYTGAGLTFAVSTNAPGTYNLAGYQALTYTTVGKLTNAGEFPGRVYEIISQMFLSGRGEQKAKGGFKLGSQTLTVTFDPSDAGQAALATAIADDNPQSVAFIHSTGTLYARALVNGGPRQFGDVNTPYTRSFVLEYSVPNTSTDGIIFG